MTEELTFKEMEDLYLDFVDGPRKDPDITDPYNLKCKDCNVEKVYEDCFKVCPECGVMDIDDPIYEDTPWTPAVALYKRRLYCQEKLKLMTGHKLCRSPHYKKIVKELKDYDIQNIIELKQYLKEWKLKRFYKYIYNMYFDVTKIRLITLSSQDIDFLSRKFVELESQFKMSELHKRKNMFNYNSCLYLLMKKYKYKGYEHILLPLNHLQIAKTLRKLIL